MKRILTIAGSDSGGGAGIQADLKTITLLGGFGMSALTALTAQNTVAVEAIHEIPLNFIEAQIDAVFSDIGVDAVKTGMLSNVGVVQLVADKLAQHKPPIVVVDPVMVAKSGDPLLADDARETLAGSLLPLATLVTPNLPEASALIGWKVGGEEDMRRAAEEIYRLGPKYVLVKGGHLEGEPVDLLFDGEHFHEFRSERVNTKNVHGTGCTYASAIATYLAQELDVVAAVAAAKRFITGAIRHGLSLGRGHGPTNPYAVVSQDWKR
ncbi:MAG: bifunctional hydroxymethylpyrimidine kinase/phosphomethylpyrimidine kinase [Syntrophobacterales bacterium]|jgi:hydroxymethylpyrimidine kinase/phosphomethylpyrimidine kinase